MPVEAVLITGPAIDFPTLLSLTHHALGYNIASAADASHRKMVDAEKFLSCLAAFKEELARSRPNLLSHVSFSVLVIASERDLLDILEQNLGNVLRPRRDDGPRHESGRLDRHFGTVARRRVLGNQRGHASNRARCYSKILLLFDRAGLTLVWNDFERHTAADHSGFLLEDKRKQ